jgi:hypothetical protein
MERITESDFSIGAEIRLLKETGKQVQLCCQRRVLCTCKGEHFYPLTLKLDYGLIATSTWQDQPASTCQRTAGSLSAHRLSNLGPGNNRGSAFEQPGASITTDGVVHRNSALSPSNQTKSHCGQRPQSVAPNPGQRPRSVEPNP